MQRVQRPSSNLLIPVIGYPTNKKLRNFLTNETANPGNKNIKIWEIFLDP